MEIWDAHCHLVDPRWDDQLDLVLGDALSLGIKGFGLAGYSPSDWNNQIKIKESFSSFQFALSFGLHPEWVSTQTAEGLEVALDDLARQIKGAEALGELGLDGRYRNLETWSLQQDAFRNQLELATMVQKPVVLHSVRAHSETVQTLELYGHSLKGGFVHAFAGNKEKARDYLDLNLSLSVGGAVTYPRSKDLHEVVRWIPRDRLLLETDSPDQKIQGWQKPLHWPSALMDIARVVAELREESLDSILQNCTKNFLRIMGLNKVDEVQ